LGSDTQPGVDDRGAELTGDVGAAAQQLEPPIRRLRPLAQERILEVDVAGDADDLQAQGRELIGEALHVGRRHLLGADMLAVATHAAQLNAPEACLPDALQRPLEWLLTITQCPASQEHDRTSTTLRSSGDSARRGSRSAAFALPGSPESTVRPPCRAG